MCGLGQLHPKCTGPPPKALPEATALSPTMCSWSRVRPDPATAGTLDTAWTTEPSDLTLMCKKSNPPGSHRQRREIQSLRPNFQICQIRRYPYSQSKPTISSCCSWQENKCLFLKINIKSIFEIHARGRDRPGHLPPLLPTSTRQVILSRTMAPKKLHEP